MAARTPDGGEMSLISYLHGGPVNLAHRPWRTGKEPELVQASIMPVKEAVLVQV